MRNHSLAAFRRPGLDFLFLFSQQGLGKSDAINDKSCRTENVERGKENISCCSGTTDRAKEAEWRQNYCQGGSRVAVVAEWRYRGRHSDRSMGAIGRPKETEWWYEEGKKCRSNWYTMFTTVCILRGDQWPNAVYPFCDHGDVYAFPLPPLSDLWATDLLGDLCATVLNMLKTSWRPWRPWRWLNVLCTTLERQRQPLGLLAVFKGDLANFVVAQGRHNGHSQCVKGISKRPHLSPRWPLILAIIV